MNTEISLNNQWKHLGAKKVGLSEARACVRAVSRGDLASSHEWGERKQVDGTDWEVS